MNFLAIQQHIVQLLIYCMYGWKWQCWGPKKDDSISWDGNLSKFNKLPALQPKPLETIKLCYCSRPRRHTNSTRSTVFSSRSWCKKHIQARFPIRLQSKGEASHWAQPLEVSWPSFTSVLSHFPSPALLSWFHPHRFPLSLLWGRLVGFWRMNLHSRRQPRTRANGSWQTTLGVCFYPLGGVLAQQDTRDDIWEEDELWSDSLGLEFTFPCVSTSLWVSGGGC